MKQEFIFEQKLSLWELYRSSLYQLPQLKVIRRLFYFLSGVFVLSIILSVALSKKTGTSGLLNDLLPGIKSFLMLFAFLFIGTFLILLILRISKPTIFNSITYQFTHWGMFKKNTLIDYSCPWRNIVKVKQTKSWILLYTSGAGAHVIKKKLFTDKNELDMFLAFVKSNVGKA